MQAILPLAGKGTRLRPHTHTRPKPLLRVANRPVLDYVIRQLEEIGVDEIIGITGHLAPTIEAWLAEEHPVLRFRPVPQEQQLGTADAIRLAAPYVDGPVLIVFVDTLFDADLGLIRERPDVDGIIWAKEVEDYQRFGVIVTDDDDHMVSIVEKPSEPISRLANIGLYYVRDWRLMFEGISHVMAQPPQLGEYFRHRAELMVAADEGMTSTYNRFHDPHEQSEGILELRRLHGLMDGEVLRAYGWDDLAESARCEFLLDYEEEEDDADAGPPAAGARKKSKKKKPWRLRWPDDFRDEVLARLLELNAQRAKEEQRAGLAAVAEEQADSTTVYVDRNGNGTWDPGYLRALIDWLTEVRRRIAGAAFKSASMNRVRSLARTGP